MTDFSHISRSNSSSASSSSKSYLVAQLARISSRPRHRLRTPLRNSSVLRLDWPGEASTASTLNVSHSTAAQSSAQCRQSQVPFHRRPPRDDPGSPPRRSLQPVKPLSNRLIRPIHRYERSVSYKFAARTHRSIGVSSRENMCAGDPSQPCSRALLMHQLALARPLPSWELNLFSDWPMIINRPVEIIIYVSKRPA